MPELNLLVTYLFMSDTFFSAFFKANFFASSIFYQLGRQETLLASLPIMAPSFLTPIAARFFHIMQYMIIGNRIQQWRKKMVPMLVRMTAVGTSSSHLIPIRPMKHAIKTGRKFAIMMLINPPQKLNDERLRPKRSASNEPVYLWQQ